MLLAGHFWPAVFEPLGTDDPPSAFESARRGLLPLPRDAQETTASANGVASSKKNGRPPMCRVIFYMRHGQFRARSNLGLLTRALARCLRLLHPFFYIRPPGAEIYTLSLRRRRRMRSDPVPISVPHF